MPELTNNPEKGTFNDITKEEMKMIMMFRTLSAERKIDIIMDLASQFDVLTPDENKSGFDSIFYDEDDT